MSNALANNTSTQNNSREDGNIINFPKIANSIRPANLGDIKSIVELWANSATLRYFYDPIRWRWKGKASEIWSDYAYDVLNDVNRFMIVCDLKDNGFSGFLIARIDDLPAYYEDRYSLTVEDIYIRPKDRNVDILNKMIDCLLSEAYKSKNISNRSNKNMISFKIEIIDAESPIASLIEESGFKKSSCTFTASINSRESF